MAKRIITLDVPVVEKRNEKRTDDVTRVGSYEDKLVVTVELDKYEEVAHALYMWVTGQREEFVTEVLEERDPEALEDFVVHAADAEIGLFAPDRETVYLAAVRATEDSNARNVVNQLLRWVSGEDDFDDIKDGRFRCRELVEALVENPSNGSSEINPEEQLSDIPDDHEAYF